MLTDDLLQQHCPYPSHILPSQPGEIPNPPKNTETNKPKNTETTERFGFNPECPQNTRTPMHICLALENHNLYIGVLVLAFIFVVSFLLVCINVPSTPCKAFK